jgi:hypothetical protein
MGRLHVERQVGGLAILVVALSLGFAARAAAAQPIADLRGEWAASATVGTTTYPQTLHITSEDFTTGQIGGIDVGADGATFTLVGQISGATVTMTISNASYQSNTTAAIIGTAPSLHLSGTFSDTNHSNGTFSANLSIQATITAPASAGSTATPATATISATADGQAATVTNPPPVDSGPANDLPLIALGVAAVLLLGLGVAAATGLVPGAGLGGSATGSGGGQADAQQIERAKIQQDARPSISPIQQDVPVRPAPTGTLDTGLDPAAGQAPAASGQQIERAKIQQDMRPSISPIQQDMRPSSPPIQDMRPSSPPIQQGIPPRPIRAGIPDTGPDLAGPAGASPDTAAPTDAPPTA